VPSFRPNKIVEVRILCVKVALALERAGFGDLHSVGEWIRQLKQPVLQPKQPVLQLKLPVLQLELPVLQREQSLLLPCLGALGAGRVGVGRRSQDSERLAPS
jgi:hypothetical protein